MNIQTIISGFFWLGLLCANVQNGYSQSNLGSDIIFVLDGSDRVGSDNFEREKDFIKQLVEYWDIAPDANRVGLVTYGDGAQLGPTLSQGSTDYNQVIASIDGLQFPGGSSDAADAMKMAASPALSTVNGARHDRPQIVIHVAAGSDGRDPADLEAEVKAAVGQGRRVYTVAVGHGWAQGEPARVSSSPASRYALTAASFPELAPLLDPLIEKVANEVPTSDRALPAPTLTCLPKADVMLVVDGSNSVGDGNFGMVKEQLKQIVAKMPVSSDGVHVGMVQYSGKQRLEFPLSMYPDRVSVMSALDQVTYLGGGTRTADAITYAAGTAMSRQFGARDAVPRVMLLVTDGTSANVTASKAAADAARARGIQVLALGVGNQVSQAELTAIAGGAANHVFTVSGFDAIGGQVDRILQAACDASGTIPPPTQDPFAGAHETCYDRIDNCQQYVDAYVKQGVDFCQMTNGMPQDQCPFTCNLCTTVIPPTPGTCVDVDPNCKSYNLADCGNPQFRSFFMDHCPAMCGLCSVEALTDGYKGACMYNGTRYAQGATWDDGCDYQCTCTDAAHGEYKCTSRCDIYHDLPSACTLVKTPGQCCLQPVCNFKTSITQTNVTAHVAYNGEDYCQYQNQRYAQNEYFEDGCSKKCTCVDAAAGKMVCSDFCPSYDITALPAYCSMEHTAGQCCQRPRCEFPTTSGSFTGSGTLTGTGLGKQYWDPTAQPTCVDLDPKCINYDQATCSDTKYYQYMLDNCPVFCGLCDIKYAPPTPGPSDYCIHNGTQYSQGQRWKPDCGHTCVCDSQVYGYYRCFSTCAEYDHVPAGCQVKTLAGKCCPEVVCPATQPLLPSTTNILTTATGSGVTVGGNQILPQVFINGTLDPSMDGTGIHRPPIKGCLYEGTLLVQGAALKGDKCGAVCTCTDADTGTLTCYQRCPVYASVDARCTLVPDTADACCQVPSCPAGVSLPHPTYAPAKPTTSVASFPRPDQLIPGYHGPAPATAAPAGAGCPTFPPGQEPPSYVACPTMPPNAPTITDCGNAPADIHFLLDVSGSLETANFNKQMEFVKQFARSFTIGPNNIQIGITTFSTTVHQQFWMNQYQNSGALLQAISQVPYPSGDTRTDLGLDFVHQNAFTPAHGDRDNARNILIIITDGQSTRPDLTNIAANNIHQSNLNIYAIGVGDHIERSELELIASTPNNVFTVQNYDGLNEIQSFLHKDSCEGVCHFNFTGKDYKQGEAWQYNCQYNCLCTDGYAGKYICKDMCKKFMCPDGYACREDPDPDYPCCKLMTVIGPATTQATQIPPTNFRPGCTPVSFQPPPQLPPTASPKPTKDCGSAPADIQFLLDVSGSVGQANFQKQLDFVKQFASGFTIGPNAVQVGATIFSTNPSNVFWLNDHQDKPSLLSAIQAIPYPGGTTRTDLGLDFVRTNAFTNAHGDRPNANNILIVITDGQSTDPGLTKTASEAIHRGNINVFAIGVGSQVTQSELALIASTPGNVFTVNNFDALDSLQASLQQTTCEGSCYYNATGANYKEGESWKDGPLNCLCLDGDSGHYQCNHICKTFTCPSGYRCTEYPDPNFPFCKLLSVDAPAYPANCPANQRANFTPECTPVTYNPPPTRPAGATTSPVQDCGSNPADIHFLLDSSGSVGQADYQKQLDFVKQFAQSFNISSTGVRIGVTTFSSGVHHQFWMNDHMTTSSLVNAIQNVPYNSGTTATDLALDFVRQNAFTAAHGDRPGVSNILIVITDGQSTNPTATQTAAENLHKTNINAFAIGVGAGASDTELKLIASDPANVYTVSNFDALNNIEHALKNTACEGTCHYNKTGANYKTGQQWRRGCEENCVCLDGNLGTYTCKPVCKQLTCPSGYTCTEYPDPHNPCCKLLRMTIPALPSYCDGGQTTPPPTAPPTEYTPQCTPLSYNTPTVYNMTNLHQQTDCGARPADIHFLVDSSGSVGTANFQKTKEFIKQFAQSFNISQNGVHIGVTTFSSGVHHQFWMNDHMTTSSLVNAIDGINYDAGSTRTDLGLDFVRQQAFTAAHGDRPNVNNILVVITDGGSTDPPKTKVSAEELHKGNINVLSVGVGSGVHPDELELIASDPSNVYTVNNFDALTNIETDLKATACEGSCHFDQTGANYKEGETWKHGCSLTCTCLDGKTGTYQCQDRCKPVPRCPRGYQCTEFQDPANQCCRLLKIELPRLDPSCPLNVTDNNFRPGCIPVSLNPPPAMPITATTAAPHDCGSAPADIHFLIDASGSVGATNFQKQLDFVKNFVNNFNISASAVNVGVTTFDSSVHPQFWLKDHQDKQSLITAISGIQFTAGGTNTDIALDAMRTQAFSAAHGDRNNAQNILIILTDGQSTDFAKTSAAAQRLHTQNIDVFSIGVGTGVNQQELELMASSPQNVYNVNSFDALNNIQHNLKQTTCEGSCHYNNTGSNYKTGESWRDGCDKNCICTDGNKGTYVCKDVCRPLEPCPSGYNCSVIQDPHNACCSMRQVRLPTIPPDCPQPKPLPNPYTPGCEPQSYVAPPVMPPKQTGPTADCGTNYQADIQFLLDSSGSVGQPDFQKQLEFVKQFAQSFNVGPQGVHIGVTTFSTTTHNQFWMNTHQDVNSLINGINRIQYQTGDTHTNLGLDFVRQNAFTAPHGDRPNVNNILIVITDGQSTEADLTKVAADNIHKENINIFAIGVGSNINKDELKLIASADPNVYTVASYDALHNIQDMLQKTTCEGSCSFNLTGQKYKEGDRWQHGCDLNCLCVDGQSGQYTCTSVCKPLAPCPAGFTCTPYPDPAYPCCNLQKIAMKTRPASCPQVAPTTGHDAFPAYAPGCQPASYLAPPTMPTGTTHAPITDCGSQPADIHFLVDSSGSVGTANFQKQLDFIQKFAESFNISANNVRIGVDTFSTTVHHQFWMNDHMTKADLVNAIKNIPYQSGNTHTDLGLKHVREQAFTAAHGDRPGVKNILIVTTDGQSSDSTQTKAQADLIHKENIDIFGLGVGSGIDRNEIEYIASSPQNVYTVNNFDALDTIQLALKKTACEGTCHYNGTGRNYKTGESWRDGCTKNCLCVDGNSGRYVCHDVCAPLHCPAGYNCTQVPDPDEPCCKILHIQEPPAPTCIPAAPTVDFPPGKAPPSFNPLPTYPPISGTRPASNATCRAPLDLLFLVDKSASIKPNQWVIEKQFVEEAIRKFHIGPNDVQIATALFANFANHTKWCFDDYHTQAELIQAARNLSCPECFRGKTATGHALQHGRETMLFNTSCGARANVPKVVIVLTDGHSTEQPRSYLVDQAHALQATGAKVITIGVGNYGLDELKLIASDDSLVFTAADFSQLLPILDNVATKTCEVGSTCVFNYTGASYHEGERWRYGCQYNCLCTDGLTGAYTCTDVCKRFTCPAGFTCTEYPDPDFPCCKLLHAHPIALQPAPVEFCTDTDGHDRPENSVWSPNCDRVCSCDDASTNTITCSARCPTYSVPAGCLVVKEQDPDDPCCTIPICHKDPTATESPWSLIELPTGGFEVTSKPGEPLCTDDGHVYKQSDSWFRGCDYKCTCINQNQGRISCQPRCPRYDTSRLPPGCRLVADPADTCCQTPVCSDPSVTGSPFMPLATLPPSAFNVSAYPHCTMKGALYFQGNEWNDGCDSRCRCEDAASNHVVCVDRCPTIRPQPGCHIVDDPQDLCCKTKDCPVSPTLFNFTHDIDVAQIPTLSPDFFIGGPAAPTPGPDGHVPAPIPRSACEYGGHQYHQNETWSPDCDKTCTCTNERTGQFKCSTRCPRWPASLPAQCRLTAVPGDACCQQLDCSTAYLTPPPNQLMPPTATPPSGSFSLTQPSVAPGTQYHDVCEDATTGRVYAVGQIWYSGGCDLSCYCAQGGVRQCQARCKTYSVPAGMNCTSIRDPSDPHCCTVPQCVPASPTPAPTGAHYLVSVAPPGSFVGVGQATAPPPTKDPLNPSAPEPSPIPKCVFRDQMYDQDAQWQDGCRALCTCLDADKGQYTCTDLCPRYPPPPHGCYMVGDPAQPCCKRPFCPDTVANLTPPPALDAWNHTLPPTQAPPQSKCVYSGVTYAQGAEWTQDCEFRCTCDDASTGSIRCQSLCPQYQTIPGCRAVVDPLNPCCTRQVCPPRTPAPTPPPTGPDGNTLYAPLPTDPDSHVTLVPQIPTDVAGHTLYQPVPTRPDGRTKYPFVPVGVDGNTLSPYIAPPTRPDGVTLLPPVQVDETGHTVMQPVIPPTVPGGYTKYPYLPVDENGVTLQPWITAPRGPDGSTLYPFVPVDGHGNTLRPPVPTDSWGLTVYPPGVPVTDDAGHTVNPPIPTDAYGHPIPNMVPVGIDGLTLRPAYTPVTDAAGHTPYAPVPVGPGGTLVPPVTPYTGPTPYPAQPVGPDGRTLQPPVPNPTDEDGRTRYPKVPLGPDGSTLYPPVPRPTDTFGHPVDPNKYPPTDHAGHTLYPTPTVVVPVPYAPPQYITGQRVDPPGTDPNKPKRCEMQGNSYMTGDTWVADSPSSAAVAGLQCGPTCRCEDQNTGRYRCDNRCPAYRASDMPYYCRLETDPADPCCQAPVCHSPITPAPPRPYNPAAPATVAPPLPGQPTNAPVPTQQVPISASESCVYKSLAFVLGQAWEDGCARKCRCVEVQGRLASVCSDRCPKYESALPQGCFFTTDPDDPDCCQVVTCPPARNPDGSLATPSPAPGAPPLAPNATAPPFVVTQPPKVFYGSLPTQRPGVTQIPDKKCVYGGRQYSTGQTWQDGCRRRCECLDQDQGLWKCTELCQSYASVPAQCSLQPDPANACCRLLVCDASAPTPTPPAHPVTLTPSPRPFNFFTTTPDPNAPTTPPTMRPVPVFGVTTSTPPPSPQAPVSEYCNYNGLILLQGDTFNKGCAERCRCEDAKRNIINCHQRCPVYAAPPDAGCVQVVDPNDECCRRPECPRLPDVINVVTPTPKTTIYPQLFTTTPLPVPKPVVVPGGTITGQDPHPQPGMEGVCVYKAAEHFLNDVWKDGCGVTCTCLDPATNRWSCTDRCPTFQDVPTNCFLSKAADGCCDTVTCYPPAMLNSPPPTQPTLVPGAPTQAAPTPAPSSVCVYNGVTLTQGQVYNDGCRARCECQDPATNHVVCRPRCLTYDASPACELVPSPDDPQCCQIPHCFVQNPDRPVGVTGAYTAVMTPPTVPTAHPPTTAYPGQPTPTPPAPREGCYARNQLYAAGAAWTDGCSTCTCLDAHAATVKCTSMCPDYPALPGHCSLVRDPVNPCCRKVQCADAPTPPTPPPPGVTTLTPPTAPTPTAVCVENGVPHSQGSSWSQGCRYTLTCEDAATNTVSKRDRCPALAPPQTGCHYETSADACCQMLVCQDPNSPDPAKVLTGVPGTITGQGKPPRDPNPLVPQTKGCYVNQQVYSQGQSWQDGCSLVCRCDDADTGAYTCKQRCAPLPATLPSTCSLVRDPQDSCCQVASCVPPQQLVTMVTVTPDPAMPNVTQTVMVPSVKGVCMHQGQYLRPGQRFYEENCGQVCTCEDAAANLVRCSDLCGQAAPQAGCTAVPDPAHPDCCTVLDCPLPPTYTPPTGPDYAVLTAPPQTFTGRPVPPTPLPDGSTPTPNYSGCVYGGQTYPQGAKWTDGCDFYCQCDDAQTGTYSCTKRCPTLMAQAECVEVADPHDACCTTLFCDFVNPTPFPSGLPANVTPVALRPPTRSPYTVTGGPTMQPPASQPPATFQKGFCLHQGVRHLQGSTWDVACSQRCTCLNATTGAVLCQDRCPAAPPAPGCLQRVSPTDPCCTVQDCTPGVTDPVFQVTLVPPGPTPTYAPNLTAPGEVVVPPGNPATYVQVIETPPQPGDNNTPRTMCVAADGTQHPQGDSWTTADAECTCMDAALNKIKCTERCASYHFLDPTCRLVADPANPPCMLAVCPQGLSPVPATAPTPPPTQPTVPPTTPTPPPFPVCIYRDGHQYRERETWEDGCQHCVCVDPTNNDYQCTRTCPAFGSLPAYCVAVPDPNSQCCQTLNCTKDGVQLTPIMVDPITHQSPPVDPQRNDLIPVVTHPVTQGHGDPTGLSPQTLTAYGGRHACVYKGTVHRPGDSWNDGCEQSCTCEPDSFGLYSCVQTCGLQPPIPPYCREVHVPGECCTTYTCDIPKVGPYIPAVAVTTILDGYVPPLKPGQANLTIMTAPVQTVTIQGTHQVSVPGGGYPVTWLQIQKITDRCVRDMKAYAQDEIWQEDGCQTKCQCVDASKGFFQCTAQCPSYEYEDEHLPEGCLLTVVNGSCCKRILCNDRDTGLTFDPIKNPRPGYLVYEKYPEGFSGFRPYYVPEGVSTNFVGCYLNQQVYPEGHTWRDGCSQMCTCTDGNRHQIACQNVCYRYENLPANCHLVAADADHCCPHVECTDAAIIPVPHTFKPPIPDVNEGECLDTISNCEDYGHLVCRPRYAEWAKKHCPDYCGLCPNKPLEAPKCRNELEVEGKGHCSNYPKHLCLDEDSKSYMYDNCFEYCGHCTGCMDLSDDCQPEACVGLYEPWGRRYCSLSCGFCGNTTSTVISGGGQQVNNFTGMNNATSMSSWLLLLKGTANLTGDLYQLWNTPGGLNEKLPGASELSATHPFNYKSWLADSFGRCHFEKIRVSVWNEGHERGFVVFDAQGATKQNVFSPSRVLSSSWNDIRTGLNVVPPKDNSTGREWSLLQTPGQCTGTGWLYVSTGSGCPHDNGSPSGFHFSPSSGAVSFDQMATGDVLAIMAQGGDCGINSTNGNNSTGSGHAGDLQCDWLGTTYQIGDKWNDSCSVQCECSLLNSTHSAVRCVDTCPSQAGALPANCRMERQPGQCCAEIKCDGCLMSQNATTVHAANSTWREGCEKECTCHDDHSISCTPICLDFESQLMNSPYKDKCTFPAPTCGKCCAMPQCSINLNFQITGYENDYCP